MWLFQQSIFDSDNGIYMIFKLSHLMEIIHYEKDLNSKLLPQLKYKGQDSHAYKFPLPSNWNKVQQLGLKWFTDSSCW